MAQFVTKFTHVSRHPRTKGGKNYNSIIVLNIYGLGFVQKGPICSQNILLKNNTKTKKK